MSKSLTSSSPTSPQTLTSKVQVYLPPFSVFCRSAWTSIASWLGLYVATTGIAAAQETKPDQEAQLRQDVAYLAADERQGRGVGTEGLMEAANYIAQSYEKSGLKLDLFEGKPFQTFTIRVASTVGPESENRLTLEPPLRSPNPATDATDPGPPVLNRDFRPLAIGTNGSVAAGLVFAGYGISAPEYQYDDYEGLDAQGRIVMILRKEPDVPANDSRFEGSKNSRHAFFETKLKNAKAHGAVAVLLINDTKSIEENTKQVSARIDKERERLTTLDQQLSDLPADATNSRESLTRRRASTLSVIDELERERRAVASGLMDVTDAGNKAFVDELPVISISRDLAEALFKSVNRDSVQAICDQIQSQLRPTSFALPQQVALKATLTNSSVPSSNVIGVLEGKGALADESVVVGAHYDHVGMGGEGSLAPGTVAVHNGADDNASGTAVLLAAVNQIVTELRTQTSHRRVVFIAFTGEERGLLGSEYYVRNPRYPLEKTVAMINLDMVGRLRDNDLTVYGTGTAKEMEAIVDQANETTGFKLYKVASGFGPSDHQSFYTNQVPVLFFFTGLHNDYHRPSDDFDKINFNGLARITDITSNVAVALATRRERLEYAATSKDVSIRWLATAYLGVQLRETSDGKGVMVSGIAPGGPAELAGIQVGDTLVKIDGNTLRTTGEVLELIRVREVDDPLKIELLRGDTTLQVTAILKSRPGG